MLNAYQLAYLFRTVNPPGRDVPSIPSGIRIENIVHNFSAKYPVGVKTQSKIRFLQEYESFIHSIEVHVKRGHTDETIKNIFRYVVPRVCEVQVVTMTMPEYTSTIFNDFDIPVESIVIETPILKESDVEKIVRNIQRVQYNRFSSICVRAWHNVTAEKLASILETHNCTSCTWEIGDFYFVLHKR